MNQAKTCALVFSVALVSYAQQPWKGKPLAEWTEDDARQVLSNSPWAKLVTPKVDRSESSRGGYGGRRGGMGGGIGGMGGRPWDGRAWNGRRARWDGWRRRHGLSRRPVF